MNTSQELANRFREVILNGTWIAKTNYLNELENLDWQQAKLTSISKNSIAILAQHVHYYIKGVKNVLEGGSLGIRDKYSFDFDDISSQEQWMAFLQRFWADAEDLSGLIEKLSDDQLNQEFTDPKYGTYQRNLEAIIEHCYYHLGQIVLINKSLS